MSDTFQLGVFVCPAYMEPNEEFGMVPSNPVVQALNAEPYNGTIPYMPYFSGVLPEVTDNEGNPVLPRRLAAGACLVLVQAPSGTVVNALDALPDVRRLWEASPTAPAMTDSQKNAVETFLRDRGIDTDFSDTGSMRVMAERVAVRIVPGFTGFPPGWFPPGG
jgi:hypothetical protein